MLKIWERALSKFSSTSPPSNITMKESVFPGFDPRFIKPKFDAEPICCLGFLIASRNKVLRAISRFRAPPRNCRKCENCVVFAISFERCRAFKFCFEESKAHVLAPPKHQEYSGLRFVHARGSARCAENGNNHQNLTRDIFATRAI